MKSKQHLVHGAPHTEVSRGFDVHSLIPVLERLLPCFEPMMPRVTMEQPFCCAKGPPLAKLLYKFNLTTFHLTFTSLKHARTSSALDTPFIKSESIILVCVKSTSILHMPCMSFQEKLGERTMSVQIFLLFVS